ncbi:hypothetical protein BGP76_01150 [Reichenbachiella sp. MSK19-1]|nr:hypothetical protein BGP76_01150 [Reichenbachiella sp. MSK19-1]
MCLILAKKTLLYSTNSKNQTDLNTLVKAISFEMAFFLRGRKPLVAEAKRGYKSGWFVYKILSKVL